MTLFPMAEHLTRNEGHRYLEKTHLGQAHLAGTGPDNRTCRECKHWYCTRKRADGFYERFHPYEGGDDGMMHLGPSKCNYPIAGKAHRRVPHSAEACRLFVAAVDAPEPSREPKRKRKNATARES